MATHRFSPRVKRYRVDLSRPEPERWAPVIHREARAACALVRASLAALPRAVQGPGAHALWVLYRALGGHWAGEVRAWAAALGLPPAQLCLANCSYELAQGAEWLHGRSAAPIACTAAARWVEGQGMVHVRSLDWPLSGLGPATRVFDFYGGPQRYLTVGVPGFVGALTGLVPGAFSASLNWAPPAERPGLGWGPAFLLRWVQQTCPSYACAVRTLRYAPLAVPALFLVCGAGRNKAAAVERTRAGAFVMRLRPRDSLAQANHYTSPALRACNACLGGGAPEALATSHARSALLAARLARLAPHSSADRARQTLRRAPVQTSDSHQQLVLWTRSGALRAWARH